MKQMQSNRGSWGAVALLGVACVIVFSGIAGMFFQGSAKPEKPTGPRIRPMQSVMTEREMKERLGRMDTMAGPPPDAREEALQQIEEYQARIEADPEDPERPALQQAMGNLYRQKLLDYASAAYAYQQVIREHPDWINIPQVYVNLATCYEKMDDDANTRRTYMEMMRVLPPDTQEYFYAKEKLGL